MIGWGAAADDTAVAVMATGTTPQGVKILADYDGLPSLGQMEQRLHKWVGATGEAIKRLESLISDSFAETRGSLNAAIGWH